MDGGFGVRFDGVVASDFSLFGFRFAGVFCTGCLDDDDEEGGGGGGRATGGISSFDDNEMISISTGRTLGSGSIFVSLLACRWWLLSVD